MMLCAPYTRCIAAVQCLEDRGPLALRNSLFYRVTKDFEPTHPAKNFVLSRGSNFFTDSVCLDIMLQDTDPMNDHPRIFPLTIKWLKTLTPEYSISSKTAKWVVSQMPSVGSGDVGTPETMSSSLPYLDKISVVCTIFTSILSCIILDAEDNVPKSSILWDLASDGIEKEIYEWDSSFVARLLGQNGIDRVIPSPESDSVARKFIQVQDTHIGYLVLGI